MNLPKTPKKKPSAKKPARTEQPIRANPNRVRLLYKGFPEDVRTLSHDIPSSLKYAKGSLYETWFMALKVSPYYSQMCEGGKAPSQNANETFRLFGDLREKNFDTWWVETGYGLFAEQRPFNSVKIESHDNDFGEGVKVLKLEVPLNVAHQVLEQQFRDLLKVHHPHYTDFNRWDTATALLPLNNRKLKPDTLNHYLYVYETYLNMQGDSDSLLYELGVTVGLKPAHVVKETDTPKLRADKHIKMAAAVSDYLEKAKNLVAHATEGVFPSVDDHPWIERKSRPSRKKHT